MIGQNMTRSDRRQALVILVRARRLYPIRGARFWNYAVVATVQAQVKERRSVFGDLYPMTFVAVGEYFMQQEDAAVRLSAGGKA